MGKFIIHINGMHCKSCEILLEKSIENIKNVKKVSANKNHGTIEIEYEIAKPDEQKIYEIIQNCGYKIGTNSKKESQKRLSANPIDYIQIITIGILIYSIYYIFQIKGIFFDINQKSYYPSLFLVLITGLTAGISSCMAVVGGLILAISAKWNQNKIETTVKQRFFPHIYFNIGRIFGFAILGGLLGAFGNIISISNVAFGVMTLIVGIIMFMLGINLTNISPKISNISITLPKFLSRVFHPSNKNYIIKSSLIGGFMSFFLPCGFTLAMQMYAISTKNFLSGALVMAIFAIGTLPGLMGIGGLVSIIKGRFANIFFKITGIIVLMIGLFNISNSISLIKTVGAKNLNTNYDIDLQQIQEIEITQNSNGYTPESVQIKPNSKIRLKINSTNQWTCASQFMIPSLNIQKSLQKGMNIIEFISPKNGEIDFMCTMGMYKGKFVIKN